MIIDEIYKAKRRAEIAGYKDLCEVHITPTQMLKLKQIIAEQDNTIIHDIYNRREIKACGLKVIPDSIRLFPIVY